MITDKEALRQLRIIDMMELTESATTYPDDEREDMNDMEVVLHEAEYFLEMYHEGGTVYSDDLYNAKELISDTKNGTVFQGMLTSRELVRARREVEIAKKTVNEYNRLKRGVERLRKLCHGNIR